MSKLEGIIRGCKDIGRGFKVLAGVKPFARGDKKLAIAANLIQKAITMAGARGVGAGRRLTINTIDDVLKERLKKNPLAKEEELLKPFLNTPDFMDLLKELDMGERDLKFFVGEALKKGGKND